MALSPCDVGIWHRILYGIPTVRPLCKYMSGCNVKSPLDILRCLKREHVVPCQHCFFFFYLKKLKKVFSFSGNHVEANGYGIRLVFFKKSSILLQFSKVG